MRNFRKLFSWAPTIVLATLLATACADSETVNLEGETAGVEATPIVFGTYLAQNAQTRAGAKGDIVGPTADSGNKLGSTGYEFGVFGYYSDNGNYNNSSSTPNFMYNQKVEYKGSPASWEYTPIKYWPNEFGSTASSDTRVDKLTFFAYAPYVATSTAGAISDAGSTGIVKFVNSSSGETDYANNTAGDPRIKYVAASNPADCVDLLWGVVPKKSEWNSGSGDEAVDNNGIANNATLTVGEPWKDITKQTTNGSVKFLFKHALAKLTFKIDADVDDVRDGSSDHTKEVDTNTKIYVREVTISGPFTNEGYLNLNNTTANSPLWQKADGGALTALSTGWTFKDGRKDGEEGKDGDSGKDDTEDNKYLNTSIIQGATSSGNLTGNGVTKTTVSLLTSDHSSFYVIPAGSTKLKVKITYDVLTKDDNLAGYLADGTTKGSNVENIIEKKQDITISAGNAYTITLHLGMTSVKMEATVAEWGDPTNAEVDLPINKEGSGS